MQPISTPSTVAQMFWPVKSIKKLISDFPDNPVIHHKPRVPGNYLIVSYSSIDRGKAYGVSRSQRILSPGLLLKKFDYIRGCLQYTIGLTTAQREATLRLLRYWAYYGHVYVKEAQVTSEPGCSKATYWRTIRLLKELGLVQVINRFVIRPHAQISNLYRLDRLVLLLARYLAEHGTHFWEKWLRPALTMPGQQFWSQIFLTPGDRAGPGAGEFADS